MKKKIKIKTDYKKSPGFVYNKTYYVLKAIFCSEKFEKHSRRLLEQIEKTGYTIPAKRPSSSVQVYDLRCIIDELENKGLDIVNLASDILLDFGLEDVQLIDNYYNYLEGILDKILFDKSPSFEAYGYPNYRYNNEKNPTELWIQIHPWTTKKVYDSYFPLITVLKGKLLNSIHKIKIWETFDRDLELYRLHLEVKNNIKNGSFRKQTNNAEIPKAVGDQIVLYPKYREIKRRFPLPRFEDENVARLVSDTKKKLDNIQLL